MASLGQVFRRKMLLALGVVLAAGGWSTAHAQVTVNTINVPSSVGRQMTATVSVDYSRSSAGAATITVPIPAALQVNPPVPPAGCVVVAGPAVECAVPPGGPGATGAVQFEVLGVAVGAFNLTATGTGGSSASNPAAVRNSGDLTVGKTRTAPAGNPAGGQTVTFRLQPNIAIGGDNLPAGASITVLDALPAALSDFTLTGITDNSGQVSCNSVAAANTSRQVACTVTGPITQAAFNALTIDISGFATNSGNFVNNASIAPTPAAPEPYLDRNGLNNTAALPYTVTPGTDVIATGTFTVNSVTNSNQPLTLIYSNGGPANSPAGGTVVGQIPTGFTIGAAPAGCVVAGQTITCTAGAVASGANQAFVIPLTTPPTAQAGNITVTVAPPSGLGDSNPGNNTALLLYAVAEPSGDLAITKTKTTGPLAAGAAITNTIVVRNAGISTATFTAGAGAQPLRVIDDMADEEEYVSGSAGWTCSDGALTPPVAGQHRVTCTRDAAGTLAPAASLPLTLTTRVRPGITAPVTLNNTACTGATALTRLGLGAANGPQPSDQNTGNDCQGRGVIGTPVLGQNAIVELRKESSRDGATWLDPVATPATIGGNDEVGYWRIVFATPSLATSASQTVIPTLVLTDNLPAILNLPASAPVPAHVTPPVTVTTVITGGGVSANSCPASMALAAGTGNLSCTYSDLQPGTTVTLVIQVRRPFTSGQQDNTAQVASPNAILSGTLQDSARWVVEPRLDPAVASKTMSPPNSATEPRVGQTVTFTIQTRNFGPNSIATGDLTLSDTLDPAKYTVLTATGANLNCTATPAGLVTCTNTNAVARAAVRTAQIIVRILKPAVLPGANPVYSGEINTATVALSPGLCEWKQETSSGPAVSAACNDPAAQSNNAGTVSFDVKLPLIDIQQRKVRQLPAGQAAFGYGDPLTYRMRVQSSGPSRAENVVMTDYLTIPAGFTAASVSVTSINGSPTEAGFTADPKSVTCALTGTSAVRCVLDATPANSFLDPGREVNFLLGITYAGTAVGVNTFGNQAVSCADETQSYESVGACSTSTVAGPTGVNNNTASANDLVFPKAELAIGKQTLTPSPVSINQPVQWVLTVQNNGPAPIAQIRVGDTLPANFEYMSSVLALGPVPAAAVPGSTHVCTPTPAAITAAGQSQSIACQLNALGGAGLFPGDPAAGNTMTLTITARPKMPFFTGPYATNVVNTATVAPGRDGGGVDLAIDSNPANNTATAVVQVARTSISGRVYGDNNLNRASDPSDPGQTGVPITLTGTDALGNSVTATISTGANGSYTFDVPPGSYTITKGVDPAGLADFTSNVPGTLPFGTTSGPVSAGVPATTAAGTPSAVNLINGITLAPGDAATGYNFGEIASGASIAGRVYLDANDNGIFDGGETSIPGVTVTLGGFDASANPVTRTAVTDGSGNYLFAGLLPGTYDVTQPAQPATANGATLPSGVASTLPGKTTAGSTGGVATSVAVAPSRITGIALSTGQASTGNNFGEILPATISGRVFLDPNNDALFNAGDTRLNGVTIQLTGTDDLGAAVSRSTTTSGSGTYTFTDLRPGTYTVTEPSQPPGTANGRTVAGPVSNGGTAGTPTGTGVVPSRIAGIVLTQGAVAPENNFAELVALVIPPSSISGKVWIDSNNNGVVDSGEAGIDGVTVVLSGTDAGGGTISRTAVTTGGGNYIFENLPVGAYRVTEPLQPLTSNGASLPAGITETLSGLTVPGTGASNQGTATPPATVPSSIGQIVLLAGESSVGNNFGELVPSSLSGFVYLDLNKNGVRDGGETAVPNVTITLTGTDDLGQAVNRSVQTDAAGAYRFGGLRPGNYTVTEPQQPAGTENAETNPGPVGNGGSAGTPTPRTVVPSAISGIRIVSAGTFSPDNNFGEGGTSPDVVVTKLARSPYFTENNSGVYELAVRNAGSLPTSGEIAVYDVLPRLSPQVWRITSAAGDGWSCAIDPEGLRVACRSSMVLAAGAVHPGRVVVTVQVLEGAKVQGPLRNFTLVRGGGELPAFDPIPGKPVDPGNPGSPGDGDLRNLIPSAPACVDQAEAAVSNLCVRETPIRFSVALGGRVWLDGTGERNTYDPGDKDYVGWRVLVVDPTKLDPASRGIPPGAIERTGITGSDGTYRVNNLIPGKQYYVYFQDPEGRTIFAGPVNGDRRVPQACGRSATGSDSPSRNAFLDVNMNEGTVSNELTCPEQSLPIDPNGVVYDSQTRAPVPGSIVTFRPEGSCSGYDPVTHVIGYNQYGAYDAQGNPQMTVGADGFYKFLLSADAPASCLFRLEVTAPPGYTSPSALILPTSALQTPIGNGKFFNVQPQIAPPVGSQSTTYHLLFLTGSSHNDVFNNHIPIDSMAPSVLRVVKTGSVRIVELGDTMEYSIGVAQWSGPPLNPVQLIDTLPAGFRYIPGTFRIDGAVQPDPSGGVGPVLNFALPGLQSGATVNFTYRVRVGIGAMEGNGINRARATGRNGGIVVQSNQAEYKVRVEGGVFTNDGCVVGKVYVDCNGNHIQDAEEVGIPGVRLYFDDGFYMVSDSEGKYSACGRQPRTWVLKVDQTTLPGGARLTTTSSRNVGDAGSIFVDLKNGELQRADFAEGSCSNTVLEQVKARRTRGEVSAPGPERKGGPALKFQSRSIAAPQPAR